MRIAKRAEWNSMSLLRVVYCREACALKEWPYARLPHSLVLRTYSAPPICRYSGLISKFNDSAGIK